MQDKVPADGQYRQRCRGAPCRQGGPYETLTARHSGKCADVPNQSVLEGVALTQYTCNGGGNQRLWFKDAGNGYQPAVDTRKLICR